MANPILRGVEVFSVGEWNGVTIREQDLRDIVQNFGSLGQAGRIAVKLGHDGAITGSDGDPAIGWITRVYLGPGASGAGRKLLADVEVVSPPVLDAIRRGMYRYCSIELVKNPVVDGKSYSGYALDGLALLGATPPAVTNLADLSKLAASRALPPTAAFEARICFRRDFAAPKPRADVEYADPKNSKYPIDTPEHVRAAWSYIHQEKNAAEYDPKELKAVKARIVAAWKRRIDEAGPPAAQMSRTSEPDAEVMQLHARIAELEATHEAERQKFAREQADSAAKAHRETLVADLEAGVCAGRIMPATREQFTRRLDDPTAALRFSRDDVALFIRSHDQSALLRGLCGGVSGFVHDPTHGVQLTGADERLDFSAKHASSVKEWARANGYSDVFSAWAPYLQAHPAEQRAFTAYCFEP